MEWSTGGGVAAGGLSLFWTGMHVNSWRGFGLMLAVDVLASVAQLMLTRAYATGRTLVNASLQYLGIAWSFAYGVLLFDVVGLAGVVRGEKPENAGFLELAGRQRTTPKRAVGRDPSFAQAYAGLASTPASSWTVEKLSAGLV